MARIAAARRGTDRRPSPSGWSFGPKPVPLGRRRIPIGSKFAASSRTLVVASADLGVGPPMIPASATGRTASAITRSVGSSLRRLPSSVTISSPSRARRTTMRPSRKLVVVERVQRAAEREHHVVRHVDDVRDRAQPRPRRVARSQAATGRSEHPGTAGRCSAGNRARSSIRTSTGSSPARLGSSPGCGASRPRERRHLAREPVDREEIGPVPGRLDLEHVVREREHVTERRSGLDRLGQDENPGVVAGRAPAPARTGSSRRRPRRGASAARSPARPGSTAPGRATATVAPVLEVPGAADDLPRLLLADVDAAELQRGRRRMLAGLEHVPDAEEAEVSADVGNAAPLDALDLGRS